MRVSVIISNYNYGKYLPSAIDSVLGQTYPATQILVVDDGSIDDSKLIIKNYEQATKGVVKAIYQSNQGQGAAFNRGFSFATGDIVSFIDADDTWKSDKLEQVVYSFRTSETIGVMHSFDVIDAESKVIKRDSSCLMPKGNVADFLVRTGGANYFPPTSALTYRRNALERIFPIPVDKYRLCADGWLTYCTAFMGQLEVINKPLMSYRIHGKNNFAGATKNTDSHTHEYTELAIRAVNEFLVEIHYPARIDLSQNLQYRRDRFYTRGYWDWTEMCAISQLILHWPLYSVVERALFMTRFLLRSTKLLLYKP